ncbi:Ldh family oxidoreductase [Pseudomonas sp. 3MA1]|uniref:Ldh family oxidoreductase n=1 Tax=Pseudomonas sp. 3MA1 TaxID=2699196 RepID=UPI0023DE044F|nr:Ldh family oxidoreductase [Pseudomonas sp. 3MA1]MDF2397458.1 Ldh family oxidoreductase [Pseudomonas sp. 3MA1]
MSEGAAFKCLSLAEARAFAQRCCLDAGSSQEVAQALAEATVSAQGHGLASVGFEHLGDYLNGFASGRIAGQVQPLITQVAPAMIRCDARQGIAQLGFERAFGALCDNTRQLGISLFAQHNGFTCGELGYYTRRLAAEGLVALAFCNGPPLLTVAGQRQPMYSTNPLAFAAPCGDGPSLLIDQASSATAFVNILKAAEAGEAIPQGWAVDAQGAATLSAREAMHGALLAFGGSRGANIALLVEVLAGGVAGANWSLDAPDFRSGGQSPGAGLLVIAIAPHLLDEQFENRLGQQLRRLQRLGVHPPGQAKQQAWVRAQKEGVRLPMELYRQLGDMFLV